MSEEYYIIKFSSAGTYYDGSRYATTFLGNAKRFHSIPDAEKGIELVLRVFRGVTKEDVSISKVTLTEVSIPLR